MVPTELAKLMRECDWKMSYSSNRGELTMRVERKYIFPLFEHMRDTDSIVEFVPGLYMICDNKTPNYIISVFTCKFDAIVDLIRKLDLRVDARHALQKFNEHFLAVEREYVSLEIQKQELEKLR
jgi:hypothetical protein